MPGGARAVVLCAAALGLTVPGAHAQRPAEPAVRHQGFWIGFGLGAGLNLDLDEGREGAAGYLRLGGTVNRHLLIGGELVAWAREENNVTLSQGNVTGTVYLYPGPTGGLFAKSGLGFGSITFETSSTTSGTTRTVTVTESGVGATFGVGYDLRLGNNFYLTPNLDVLIQVINQDTRSLLVLTVGVGWH